MPHVCRPISRAELGHISRFWTQGVTAEQSSHVGLADFETRLVSSSVQPKQYFSKSKFGANQLRWTSNFVGMFLRVSWMYSQELLNQKSIKKRGVSQFFSPKDGSECLRGICQNILVQIFLRGTSTYPSSQNTLKSSE